ncbi:hypothetical protein GLOIN_2v1765345 [Rhizophagus irregularis DAOM 181602=DAOM 197198]|nr:hypothetical protein GLOIN_2v1765345 [Rhizophagus irregularis DAOM 181602=DAOM 197198]
MESDQKHLTALTNIPPKSTSSESSSSESNSSESGSSSETSSSESSLSSGSSTESSSSSETSSSESGSSDSDIDEIASIDTSTDVNYISQKHIGELGITYHSESNRIVTPDTSYSTLGKVNLHIGFNDGEKYKTTPSEFIVAGPDWPDYFPDLVLGMPWLQENGVNFDMHNSLLTIDDNFTIPFEKVDYISTLSDSQIRTMTDFSSPTYSPE